MEQEKWNPTALEEAAAAMGLGNHGERLSRLAGTEAGIAVKARMEQDGKLGEAMAKGDMAEVRKSLAEILSSPEGKLLTSQLQTFLKK